MNVKPTKTEKENKKPEVRCPATRFTDNEKEYKQDRQNRTACN